MGWRTLFVHQCALLTSWTTLPCGPTALTSSGTNCVAEAPFPRTTTFLPLKSMEWSQRALWKALPWKVSAPLISGMNGRPRVPTALTTTGASCTVSLPVCVSSNVQTQSERSASQPMLLHAWLKRQCGRMPNFSATEKKSACISMVRNVH